MATNYIVQSPRVLLFKNGNRVDIGLSNKDATDKNSFLDNIKLELDEHSSGRLENFNINANLDTEPNTMTLTIAIPIPEGIYSEGSNSFADSRFVDFKSPNVSWKPMDHIELYVSVSPEVEEFYRLFAGVVTEVKTDFKGYEMMISLSCKDMFYWLSKARINPRWSATEAVLRAGKVDSDQLKNIAYNTKYVGYSFKQIIEAILYNAAKDGKVEDETQFVALGEIDFASWMQLAGRESLIGDVIKDDLLDQQEYYRRAEKKYLEEARKNNVKIRPVDDRRIKIDRQGISKVVHQGKEAVFRGAISKAQVLQAAASNQINRRFVAQYWDTQFLEFIRKNYVSYGREYDWLTLPFPFSNGGNINFIEGTYSTRLELLKELTTLTMFEIYQSTQGWVFVKPPMYNMPPLTTIDAVELESTDRSLDINNVLTSVSTEGALVAGTGDDGVDTLSAQMKAVQVETNFPFIQGTYTCLFPKNFDASLTGAQQKNVKDIDRFSWGANIDSLSPNKGDGTDGVVQLNAFETFVRELKRLGKGNDKDKTVSELSEISTNIKGQVSLVDVKTTISTGKETSSGSEKEEYLMSKGSQQVDFAKVAQLLTFELLRKNLTRDVLNRVLTNEDTYLIFFQDLRAAATSFLNNATMSVSGDLGTHNSKLYARNVLSYITDLQSRYVNFIQAAAAEQNLGKVVEQDILNGSGNFKGLYDRMADIFSGSVDTTGSILYDPTNISLSGALSTTERNTLLDDPEGKDFSIYKFIAEATGSFYSRRSLLRDKDGNLVKTINYKQLKSELQKRKLAANTIPIDNKPSIVASATCTYKLDDRLKTVGDYNVMQHGFNSTKITNRMIRTQEQTTAFAKYFMYINNASLEKTKMVLKTLRPDVVLGFPILNNLDMNVYYVNDINFSLTAGNDFTTNITGIARRRPVWINSDVPEGNQIFNNPELKAKALINPKGNPEYSDILKYESEVAAEISGTNKSSGKYKLLGWEYYGPDESDLKDDDVTNLQYGIFLPPFGGVIDSIVSQDYTQKDTGVSNIKVIKISEDTSAQGTKSRYKFEVLTIDATVDIHGQSIESKKAGMVTLPKNNLVALESSHSLSSGQVRVVDLKGEKVGFFETRTKDSSRRSIPLPVGLRPSTPIDVILNELKTDEFNYTNSGPVNFTTTAKDVRVFDGEISMGQNSVMVFVSDLNFSPQVQVGKLNIPNKPKDLETVEGGNIKFGNVSWDLTKVSIIPETELREILTQVLSNYTVGSYKDLEKSLRTRVSKSYKNVITETQVAKLVSYQLRGVSYLRSLGVPGAGIKDKRSGSVSSVPNVSVPSNTITSSNTGDDSSSAEIKANIVKSQSKDSDPVVRGDN